MDIHIYISFNTNGIFNYYKNYIILRIIIHFIISNYTNGIYLIIIKIIIYFLYYNTFYYKQLLLYI